MTPNWCTNRNQSTQIVRFSHFIVIIGLYHRFYNVYTSSNKLSYTIYLTKISGGNWLSLLQIGFESSLNRLRTDSTPHKALARDRHMDTPPDSTAQHNGLNRRPSSHEAVSAEADRIFCRNEQWYIRARGNASLGPFESRPQALRRLRRQLRHWDPSPQPSSWARYWQRKFLRRSVFRQT